jgi:hypothetical protein
MHTREIVRGRYLVQAVVSHPPAVAALDVASAERSDIVN